MGVEIEIKMPVNFETARRRLHACGAEYLGSEQQCDTYFAHPCRDFGARDEALRLRRTDSACVLTYKGPRTHCDLKIREELEYAVPPELEIVLRRIGFRVWRVLRKVRENYRWRQCRVSVDRVADLGDFLEVEATDRRAREQVAELQTRLGLNPDTTTTSSYVELLEKRGSPG